MYTADLFKDCQGLIFYTEPYRQIKIGKRTQGESMGVFQFFFFFESRPKLDFPDLIKLNTL